MPVRERNTVVVAFSVCLLLAPSTLACEILPSGRKPVRLVLSIRVTDSPRSVAPLVPHAVPKPPYETRPTAAQLRASPPPLPVSMRRDTLLTWVSLSPLMQSSQLFVLT